LKKVLNLGENLVIGWNHYLLGIKLKAARNGNLKDKIGWINSQETHQKGINPGAKMAETRET